MTQKEFLKKYKNKEFSVEKIEVDDTTTFIVKVNNKALSMTESDLFWTLYQESNTKFSDNNLEIVSF